MKDPLQPMDLRLTFDLLHGTEAAGHVGRGPVVVGIAVVVRETGVQELHRGGHHGAGALRGPHQVRHRGSERLDLYVGYMYMAGAHSKKKEIALNSWPIYSDLICFALRCFDLKRFSRSCQI